MKFEPPLANLMARCETLCVHECCGIAAYDFSPIQIASYLTMNRGVPDAAEIRDLRGQIEALRANYGSGGASGSGAELEELNQSLTAEQIDGLTDELLMNLEIGSKLIQHSDELRHRLDKPRHVQNRVPLRPISSSGEAKRDSLDDRSSGHLP